jgi:hypothetical protein
MSDVKPPFHYLATCSKVSLESFEMSELNKSSMRRKEAIEVLDAWVEAEVNARLARWVLEHRRRDPNACIESIVEIGESGASPCSPGASHATSLAPIPAPQPCSGACADAAFPREDPAITKPRLQKMKSKRVFAAPVESADSCSREFGSPHTFAYPISRVSSHPTPRAETAGPAPSARSDVPSPSRVPAPKVSTIRAQHSPAKDPPRADASYCVSVFTIASSGARLRPGVRKVLPFHARAWHRARPCFIAIVGRRNTRSDGRGDAFSTRRSIIGIRLTHDLAAQSMAGSSPNS